MEQSSGHVHENVFLLDWVGVKRTHLYVIVYRPSRILQYFPDESCPEFIRLVSSVQWSLLAIRCRTFLAFNRGSDNTEELTTSHLNDHHAIFRSPSKHGALTSLAAIFLQALGGNHE